MKKIIPWLVSIATAMWMAAFLFTRPETGFHSREFGRLPVLLGGRIQPFDSVARNALLQIRTRQSVPADAATGGRSLTATEWLMEVMMKPETADTRAIFRVDNPELLDLLQLPRNTRYCSFHQLEKELDEVDRQAERAETVDAHKRTAFEQQVLRLQAGLLDYQRLRLTLRPLHSDAYRQELDDFEDSLGPGLAAVRAQETGQRYDGQIFTNFVQQFAGFNDMARLAEVRPVPPAEPGTTRDAWETIGTNILGLIHGHTLNPAVRAYAGIVTAYRRGDTADFNGRVRDLANWLRSQVPAEMVKGRREFFFNEFQPFYRAMAAYVLAFLLACASWFNRAEILRRSAFGLIGLALTVHTVGLVFRMALEGRPPVTNLYSSAIFIGWAAAVLGLALERLFRDGLGAALASLVGFVTLIIAHHLARAGDTMEMLRAVLDTNFWLATHVVTVTLGYASTFVAGVLAIFYVLRGCFTRTLDKATGKSLVRMVYGIVCFATLFSFTGTVLGGIWADQSWGRFWGWDPKENGALLIVLWNAAILHARWGGYVRERGLMNMAIFGNIVTSFSWFGVNMLGVGLHSYGFMESAFRWLVLFVVSQVLLIGIGLLPARYWRSFRSSPVPAPQRGRAAVSGRPATA